MNQEENKEIPLHRKLFVNEPVPPKQKETGEEDVKESKKDECIYGDLPLHKSLFMNKEELKIEKELQEERLKIQNISKEYDKKIKASKIDWIITFAYSVFGIASLDMFGFSFMYDYLKKGELSEWVVMFWMMIFTTIKLGLIGANIQLWFFYAKLKKDKEETYNRFWKEYKEKIKEYKEKIKVK